MSPQRLQEWAQWVGKDGAEFQYSYPIYLEALINAEIDFFFAADTSESNEI